MYNLMEISTTRIMTTPFYSYIRRNSKELVQRIGTTQGKCKLGRDTIEFCDYIFLSA
jgi:hypothetical protein